MKLYYCYCYLYLWIPLLPYRNLDEVFTNKHMALISLRSRSNVKESMVLMTADHLCIHNYKRSLLNIFETYFNAPDGALTCILYKYTSCV